VVSYTYNTQWSKIGLLHVNQFTISNYRCNSLRYTETCMRLKDYVAVNAVNCKLAQFFKAIAKKRQLRTVSVDVIVGCR